MTQDLQKTIEDAWKNRINLTALSSSAEIREAINEVIRRLGEGILRVAEKKDGEWIVNQWVKRAVLLSFRMEEKTAGNVAARASAAFAPGTSRLAPMAIARHGSFIGKDVVIMPSFINVGAYVDEGVMIDAWVTVGSCAQIGKQVHLSGSVGIGGILEPMQVNPTIIEDNCFIGTRAEIADGVVVEENSIISAGVCIDRSTRIYDRQNDRILYGRVPSGSIVVPGSLPSPDGKYSLHCAIIMKRVDAKTRAKTAVHQLLREVESL